MAHQYGLPPMASSAAERSYVQGQVPFMANMANIQRRTEMAKLRSGEALSFADLLKRQWLNNQMQNLSQRQRSQNQQLNALGSFSNMFGQLLQS